MMTRTTMGEQDAFVRLVVRPVFFRLEGGHRSKLVKDDRKVRGKPHRYVASANALEKFVHVHKWNYL
jgi:hypothetical protein